MTHVTESSTQRLQPLQPVTSRTTIFVYLPSIFFTQALNSCDSTLDSATHDVTARDLSASSPPDSAPRWQLFEPWHSIPRIRCVDTSTEHLWHLATIKRRPTPLNPSTLDSRRYDSRSIHLRHSKRNSGAPTPRPRHTLLDLFPSSLSPISDPWGKLCSSCAPAAAWPHTRSNVPVAAWPHMLSSVVAAAWPRTRVNS